MIHFRIELQGVKDTQRRYREAPRQIGRLMVDTMERSLLVAEREVVRRTPTNKRSTGGRLRNAIMAADSKTIRTIGSVVTGVLQVLNVPYALWVEEDTKPHVIRAKRPGGRLAFAAEAGFRLRYRETATGRLLTRREVASGGAARPGVIAQRGQVLYQRAGVTSRMKVTTTTDRGRARMVFRQEVNHPGTTGQHMFRDGAKAAAPKIARLWEALAARVGRLLEG